jgi:hypothetical protein
MLEGEGKRINARFDPRHSEIAVAFGLASYASAGSAIRALRRRMVEDEVLRERVNEIMLDLTPDVRGRG